MSDFLGRVGRITEWVVVSNLENRAVNAACDKAQGWWHNRKNKHDSPAASARPAPPPVPAPPPPQPYNYQAAAFPPQQQASYVPPPPPMGNGQLLITINHVEGLNQWGPLIAIIECNYQRYQTSLGQFQQQFSFPIHQFDYDQLFVWIQNEYQQQTVAQGEIPVRVLLGDQNKWNPQQRWIPLRDQYNGPAGQILITIEYRSAYSSAPEPPPPYAYYS